MALTPEVPGVGQELSPAQGVLRGPDVAGGDLLPRHDLEPRLDLHSPVLRIVLADGVAPEVDVVVVFMFLKRKLKLNIVTYMQEWLSRACIGYTDKPRPYPGGR